MYNITLLIKKLDSVLASGNHKLNAEEIAHLQDIRNQLLANEKDGDSDKLEKGFVDLIQFLLLIKEYIDNL